MPNANLATSGTPGSAASVPPVNSSQSGPGGQTVNAGSQDFVPKSQYDELYQKFGQQGNEVGELRPYKEFYDQIKPMLEKLEQNPEVVTAIVNGQLTSDLAKAVMEGRINVTAAAAVAQAHDTVKKELGQAGYQAASPEDIAKLVEKEAGKIRTDLEEREELRNFERSTQEFINSTPDFDKFAPEIDKWLDEHDVTDIKVAYYAVKGQLSEKAAKDAAALAVADNAKDVLLNASGGGVVATRIPGESNLVDQLIAGRPNPNNLF